ncbi:MAG: hypothetical protein V2A67_09395 [Bacteroidota bacterium]
MIDDLYLTELFDRYMEEELTPSEKEGFELLLASNPVIAEKLRLFTDINKALMQEDIMQLRRQIKGIQAKNSDLLDAGPMEVARIPELVELHKGINLDIIDSLDELSEIPTAGSNQGADEGFGMNEEELSQAHLHKDVNKAIMQEDVMALRTKLSQISKLIFAARRSTPTLRKYIIYASSAAAVVIMLITGTVILKQSSNSGTDQAYAGLFQPYEAVSVTRGPAENVDIIRNTAIELYNEGDFLQAGNLLDAIICNGETSKLIRVYAGACALHNGDSDKGINYLANWDRTEPTYIDAQWFLAGCYLDKKEWGKALSILEDLVKNEYFKNYTYPAEKLIKKLHKQH